MLLNKERALQKMAEFKMDALIAAYPENVSYLSDLQSHIPYMYRHLFMESFALLPRRADVSPALIVGTVDASWPPGSPRGLRKSILSVIPSTTGTRRASPWREKSIS